MAISDLHQTDDSDVALILRIRGGDIDAYGVLHERHAGAARALAWRMSRSAADADDLVSEGFARVLAALARGNGPESAFRPYLLSTIRRLAYDRTKRERRETPVEYEVDQGTEVTDVAVDGFERDAAAAAFASLPERWRMVLWHTEVEGESPAQVAPLLGMNPNAVAALAYRAREGLRQAYLTHHATRGGTHRECRHVEDRLAAYVRDGLTPAQAARVGDHLGWCEDCQAAYLELLTVNTSMRSVLAPIVLGSAGAAYLAARASGVAPITAARAARGRLRPQAQHVRYAGVAAGVAAAVVLVVAGMVAAWHQIDRPATEVGASPTTAAAGGAPRQSLGRHGQASMPRTDPQVDGAPTTSAPEPVVVESSSVDGPAPRGLDPIAGRPDVVGAAPPAVAVPGTSEAPSAPAHPPTVPTTRPTVTVAPPVSVAPPPSSLPAPTTSVQPTPASVPTTTTTTPPRPSELTIGVSSAGGLVAGRPGVLVAAAGNRGVGDAHDVSLTLDLGSLTARGLPRGSDGPDPSSGWRCSEPATSTLQCSADAVAVGATRSLYIPVQVPASVSSVAIHGAITGTGDGASPDADVSTTLPVNTSGMAARFAAIEHGDVIASGNGLLTCPDSSPGCIAARQDEGDRLDDGDHDMVPVDADSDPTTSNSSSAAVACSGPDVMDATLYWGADLTPGTNGVAPTDPAAAGHAVVFTPAGTRVEVDAERVDYVGSHYQAVADATALVQSGGAGTWTVGGIQLATGRGNYGGWSLVVACQQASAPLRSLVIIDGLTHVSSGSGVSLEVGGFSVPAAGSAAARVTAITYEGDAGLTGDQLAVAGRAVADALNPLGNTFNSTLSDLGIRTAGDVPADANLFGFDVDRFDVSGALAPGATGTVLDLTTANDEFFPGVVAFSVDQ